ncbi:MAG: Ig-like domain repeat protein [Paludisphaera borealis]|uniref:Ig-like domain repeat protein n=1 Tax=Paludisphaera borealis TaxID=1387353 RepID=UPI00283C8375|nr:Ig-like domain repeat protein [Paludisphaera borealis]MDR3620672.1 Ig-like domain repeat protein [Paludisphaera borealis]
MKTLRATFGRTKLFQANGPTKRRRLRPTAELLEDRLAPATGGFSALGGGVPALLNGQSTTAPYVQQAKLTSSTPADGLVYGWGISLTADGDTLAVGAPGGETDTAPSAVSVYTRSNRVWAETAKLYSPEGVADDKFGVGVVISADGSTLATTAKPGEWTHGPVSLYVYSRSGSEWNLTQTVTIADSNGFGAWLSISDDGGVIAGGAPYANSEQGTAYVFTRANGVYTQEPPIVPPEGEPQFLLGEPTALSGDGRTLAIGSAHSSTVDTGWGAVSVYEKSEAGWTLVTTLTAALGSDIGRKVALNGDGSVLLAEGASLVDGFVRAVHVYNKSGSAWTQTAELIDPAQVLGSSFGQWVALSPDGATAVVGAPSANVSGVLSQGAAYVFTLQGSTWTQTAELTASDGGTGDNFGYQIAVRGRTIVVAAPRVTIGSHRGQGAVYVFDDPQGFAVTVDPVSQTGYPTTTTTFTAAATGAATLSTQWQVSTDDGATWSNIAGATNQWYAFAPALINSGNQYRAVFTNEANETIATNPATLTVVKATPVITITPSVNPRKIGDELSFQIDVGSNIPAARTPNGGVVSLTIGSFHVSATLENSRQTFSIPTTLAPGVYTVTATYDGTLDPVFGSAVATTTQIIVRASSSIEGQISATTATAGQSVTLTGVVTATGGVNPPTGRVLFTDNGQPIGFGALSPSDMPGVSIAVFTTGPLTTGEHYFQMVYQGDFETLASASGVYRVDVSAPLYTATTTTLATSRSPFTTGGAVTFTATVVDASGPGHPTSGPVDFYVGGVLVASTPLDADGEAKLTTTALVPGVYTLIARYRGWDHIQPSESDSLYQFVSPAVVTTIRLISTLNPSMVGDSVTFFAAVTDVSGLFRLWPGAIDFYVGDQLVATSPAYPSGQAAFTTSALVPGWYTLTARYRGTEDIRSSQSQPLFQTVNQSTTTLTSSPNPSRAGDAVTFTATVAGASGAGRPTSGEVDFYIGGVLVATSSLDADGNATLATTALVPGDYTLIAVYRGTEGVLGSVSDSLFQTVGAPSALPALTASAAGSPISSPEAPVALTVPTVSAPRKVKFQAMRAQIAAARAERLATRSVPQRSATAHRWR